MRATRSKVRAGAAATTVLATSVLALGVVTPFVTDVSAAPACAPPAASLPDGAIDFDGDGVADAAYGEPSRPVSGHSGAGAVRVMQSCTGSALLTSTSLGLGAATSGAGLGTTVNALDLNGDAFTDLVISAPAQQRTGAVVVVFGSPSGLGGGQSTLRVVAPGLHAGDRFGASLTTASSWVGSGPSLVSTRHLVVGAPGADVGKAVNAGAVFDMRFAQGSMSSVRWTQGSGGFAGKPERGDRFGEVLATGYSLHLDKSTYPLSTVFIGVPHENVGSKVDAGAVYVRGVLHGVTRAISQNSKGAAGRAAGGDRFGSALIGNQDSAWVGTPGDDVGRVHAAGTVQLVSITAKGKLTASIPISQAKRGVPGTPEAGDHFGSSLTFFGNSRARSLAIGVPDEDLSVHRNAGAVSVLPWRGPCAHHCTSVTQESRGIPGSSETGDRFGASLTQLYLGSEPEDAIYGWAIGVPGEDIGGVRDAGTSVQPPSGPTVRGTVSHEHLGEVPAALTITRN